MSYVKDFIWNKGMSVDDLVRQLSAVGFQSVELGRAAETITKMKESGAKTFLTFTSNMVTSGLRGFFAQLIRLRIADVIVTTVGSIEEDIMKAIGEKFEIGSFLEDDYSLYEKGTNRIGNLFITNKSYEKFEEVINPILKKLYEKQKRWPVSEMLREIGLMLDDEDSILYQAAKNNVPVFCPGNHRRRVRVPPLHIPAKPAGFHSGYREGFLEYPVQHEPGREERDNRPGRRRLEAPCNPVMPAKRRPGLCCLHDDFARVLGKPERRDNQGSEELGKDKRQL